MPSPDKLFRLDPVETKITAPVSNFQALADAADRSIANRSINRGLSSFGQALGGLAKFKKQEQITEDIKTAKDAAVRGLHQIKRLVLKLLMILTMQKLFNMV